MMVKLISALIVDHNEHNEKKFIEDGEGELESDQGKSSDLILT